MAMTRMTLPSRQLNGRSQDDDNDTDENIDENDYEDNDNDNDNDDYDTCIKAAQWEVSCKPKYNA